MAERILIVDDDPLQRRLLAAAANRLGYETITASGGDETVRVLTGAEGLTIDCVVLDLVMPDLDGLGVLGKLRDSGVEAPIIVAAAPGNIDAVMSAMRAGAADFIVKPVGLERLQVSLANALARRALERELARLDPGIPNLASLVARSTRMRAVVHAADKAAGTSLPILIEGEPGTGRALLARAIHHSGPRRTRPFVSLDLRAVPPHLIEPILFGRHERGRVAALARRVGKLVEADGGTLYLGGVDRLSSEMQAKLLHVLQHGEVATAGARRTMRIDVRVIAATCRNLLDEVRAGRFREDLFYWLQATPLWLPPLRERAEDVPALVRQFVARFAAQQGKRVHTVTPAALARLQAYLWPGNVAELESLVLRAVARADGEEIGPSELGELSADAKNPPACTGRTVEGLPLVIDDGAAAGLVPGIMEPNHPLATAESLSLVGPEGDISSLAEIEAAAIRFAVARCGGRMSEAARCLRIGRSTLYRKLEGLGLSITPDGAEHDAWQVGDSATKSREPDQRSIDRKASYVK
ncbi:MAG TPA: sigma-54 dependent transcriptional regulator [Xanthobacteraceae bacterium]|nr:sigma-54 dependent transcriptional regulator [Xanthobacteraceae bacterium]